MLRTIFRALKGAHRGILRIQFAFLIVISLILATGMFAEAFARYVIGRGFFAMEDFIGYTAVWLYFVGAAHATNERTQIKADIINMVFKSERTLSIIRAVVAAFSVVIAALMTKWSYAFVVWSVNQHETTPVYGVPFVYFQSAFLVGSGLMALYFFLELIHHSRRAYAGTPLTPNADNLNYKEVYKPS